MALYDCSPELGEQRVYSPNNPPPFGNIIDTPTTFNIPQDFTDITSCLEYLKRCFIYADVTIQLADGTYNIDEQIIIGSFMAAGSPTLYIRGNSSNSAAVVLKATSSMENLMQIYSCNNIITRYQDITFDGNNLVTIAVLLVNFHSFLHCHNINVKNSLNDGILANFGGIIRCSGHNTVSNCTTAGIEVSGCSYVQGSGTSSITIANCATFGIRVLMQGNFRANSNCQLIIQNCPEALHAIEQGLLVIVGNNMTSMSGSITRAASAYSSSFIQCIGGTTVGTFSPSINTVGNQNSYIYR